jgi:hypothetical protein
VIDNNLIGSLECRFLSLCRGGIGRIENAPDDFAAKELATSPAAWPPIPSATRARYPSFSSGLPSAGATKATVSSLAERTRPTSGRIAPATRSRFISLSSFVVMAANPDQNRRARKKSRPYFIEAASIARRPPAPCSYVNMPVTLCRGSRRAVRHNPRRPSRQRRIHPYRETCSFS